MDRTTVYIERDFLIRKIREIQAEHPFDGTERDQAAFETCEVIAGFAGSMPEGNVIPVMHGRWIIKESSENSSLCECSACGEWHTFYSGEYLPKFCPECGAKMGRDPNADSGR